MALNRSNILGHYTPMFGILNLERVLGDMHTCLYTYLCTVIAGKNLRDVAAQMNLTKYLTHIKLETYDELFKEEQVDGEMLWDMCHAEENELAALGIDNAFHRRKIKAKLEGYLKSLI